MVKARKHKDINKRMTVIKKKQPLLNKTGINEARTDGYANNPTELPFR